MTRHFIDTIRKECKCLPYSIRISDKEPLCSFRELLCVENIESNFRNYSKICQNSCAGLTVTSYSYSNLKEHMKDDEEFLFPNETSAYNDYVQIFSFPEEMNKDLKLKWQSKIRYIRIFFDTPTFDIITMDRAAKFVDMLSAIGGTMGLLTGFSIISAVEIIYFAWKIIYKIFKDKKTVK